MISVPPLVTERTGLETRNWVYRICLVAPMEGEQEDRVHSLGMACEPLMILLTASRSHAASMSISPKCPLSFVPHCQHLSLAKDLHHNTPITPLQSSFLSPTFPSFVRRTCRGAPALGLASPSSRSPTQGSRVSPSATRRMKEVVSAVRCDDFLLCSGCTTVIPPERS